MGLFYTMIIYYTPQSLTAQVIFSLFSYFYYICLFPVFRIANNLKEMYISMCAAGLLGDLQAGQVEGSTSYIAAADEVSFSACLDEHQV